jgi:hypothetical protein
LDNPIQDQVREKGMRCNDAWRRVTLHFLTGRFIEPVLKVFIKMRGFFFETERNREICWPNQNGCGRMPNEEISDCGDAKPLNEKLAWIVS